MLKTYQELSVFPENVTPTGFLEIMKKQLSGNWYYTGDRPRQLLPRESPTWEPSGCFSTRDGPELSMLFVFVVAEKDRLAVTNIVSFVKDRLSIEEYNQVLQSFRQNVVEPATRVAAARIEVTDEQVSLENLLPPSVFRKLKDFSHSANKTTSVFLPADRDRWIKFLIEAHREHVKVSPVLLRRWLSEEEGWSSESASELSSEYAFAVHLLDGLAETAR